MTLNLPKVAGLGSESWPEKRQKVFDAHCFPTESELFAIICCYSDLPYCCFGQVILKSDRAHYITIIPVL